MVYNLCYSKKSNGIRWKPRAVRKEWSFLWALPRMRSLGRWFPGSERAGTSGSREPARQTVRKNTVMSREQPEGSLWGTENVTGAKGNMAEFATTYKVTS